MLAVLLTTVAAMLFAPAARTADGNPFGAAPVYADPASWAAAAAADPSLNDADRRAAAVIAAVPQARWITGADTTESVDRYVSAAVAAGDLGVLVLYAIPHRDCHSYSAGGLDGAGTYRAWIRAVRAGIDRRPVAVIVEPDAITSADCLTDADRTARAGMLRYAARLMADDPTTAVYLDGGHSRWLPAAELARRLRAVGNPAVRGFSLNVSNFLPTGEQIAYGEEVSALVGGAHYVIDTSRNEFGPAPDAPLNWCNPAGRGLGDEPTPVTGAAHADALLWIKRPGESDGDCRAGEPASGQWFAAYATDLVARSN